MKSNRGFMFRLVLVDQFSSFLGFKPYSDNVELCKQSVETNNWLYFRRRNPKKVEVYLANEDFVPTGTDHPITALLNKGAMIPEQLSVKENDLLCVHLKGEWKEWVRFEGQWIEYFDDFRHWDYLQIAVGVVDNRPTEIDE